MQSFTIKRVLPKTLASVSSEINAILLTQIQVKHVENKHFCQSIEKQQQEGKRKKEQAWLLEKFFSYTQIQRFHTIAASRLKTTYLLSHVN